MVTYLRRDEPSLSARLRFVQTLTLQCFRLTLATAIACPRSRADEQRASLFRQERRIEGDLPEVAVGIREVTGVAAPDRLLRRLHKRCPSLFGLPHHGIDFLLAAHIVANGELG